VSRGKSQFLQEQVFFLDVSLESDVAAYTTFGVSIMYVVRWRLKRLKLATSGLLLGEN
jgi:hypothetical protein